MRKRNQLVCDGVDRRKVYSYWPIHIGWHKCGAQLFFCWHSWPDATASRLGWTIHIGNLQIYFGER